jgi:hypothetical protein
MTLVLCRRRHPPSDMPWLATQRAAWVALKRGGGQDDEWRG